VGELPHAKVAEDGKWELERINLELRNSGTEIRMF
jgi:hypothetical protein